MPPEGLHVTTESLRAHEILAPDKALRRVQMHAHRFDVTLTEPAYEGPLAAVIILDAQTPERLSSLGRFWAAAIGRQAPADQRLTPQRRQRARQMLRVVDARLSGATYRSVAESLFPQHDIDPASWVGSAIRETTIRLARDGMKLVRGGYRTLLRRPRRST